jgi:hypothetical protein
MSLKEESQESLFNLGKLAGRIPSDEGKRLTMMLRVVSSYINYLEERDKKDEDDDSRC